MTELSTKAGEQVAEFNVPQGCALCGGVLAVRLTPLGARTCCKSCRWISTPKLELERGGLSMSYVPAGLA